MLNKAAVRIARISRHEPSEWSELRLVPGVEGETAIMMRFFPGQRL